MKEAHSWTICSCSLMVIRSSLKEHFSRSDFHPSCAICFESFEHRDELSEHAHSSGHVQPPRPRGAVTAKEGRHCFNAAVNSGLRPTSPSISGTLPLTHDAGNVVWYTRIGRHSVRYAFGRCVEPGR
ncbi:uncharacterized protein B0H18DRAFT_51672 [Fomitopsis serialis]|uniref:uncharacterized protein n=1 Tax=Fomitopsis serialis TaxID=139415 RepID=UPI002008CE30|nr:uncharacterized protein B0H18DRAFT_51672 [Neoantrodia serialis]KAH9932250.1 hypothetical protein B0H18DRAFT_51672 [Neoantrodia serialis]